MDPSLIPNVPIPDESARRKEGFSRRPSDAAEETDLRPGRNDRQRMT